MLTRECDHNKGCSLWAQSAHRRGSRRCSKDGHRAKAAPRTSLPWNEPNTSWTPGRRLLLRHRMDKEQLVRYVYPSEGALRFYRAIPPPPTKPGGQASFLLHLLHVLAMWHTLLLCWYFGNYFLSCWAAWESVLPFWIEVILLHSYLFLYFSSLFSWAFFSFFPFSPYMDNRIVCPSLKSFGSQSSHHV